MGSTTIVRSEPAGSAREEAIRPRREEIRAQLARLLASPLFQHSKHYPGLLRYVVHETLEGRGGYLKERALGAEVFGRDPNYDTNADPVVRTSASEVRKRIAQYYHEPGRESEIRIELTSGTYTPEFRYAAVGPRPLAAEAPVAGARPLAWLREIARRQWVRVGVAAAAAALLSAGFAGWHATPSAVEHFWNPVWESADPVMMALGRPPAGATRLAEIAGGAEPAFRDVARTDVLPLSDALTMARLNGITREYAKRNLDIRRADVFTLTDLRRGPVILVGAFNNPWTMRLNKDLRFTFEWDAETRTGIIRDRHNPSNRSWALNPGMPDSKISRDYAVVSRFLNPLTEKIEVTVAGIGHRGTIAAGEFVTQPRYLEMLASRAPRNWERTNLQVVLATDLVNDNTGPPRILATYFW
jgi:hypothetical protein